MQIWGGHFNQRRDRFFLCLDTLNKLSLYKLNKQTRLTFILFYCSDESYYNLWEQLVYSVMDITNSAEQYTYLNNIVKITILASNFFKTTQCPFKSALIDWSVYILSIGSSTCAEWLCLNMFKYASDKHTACLQQYNIMKIFLVRIW